MIHDEGRRKSKQPHLYWVYPGSLFEALDSATWLESTNELRKLGWQVTLVGMCSPGNTSIRDIDMTCVSSPDAYLLRQVIFHLRVIRLILQDFVNIDIILFHQMSVPWLLPLRLLRRIKGIKHPLLVLDTRTLPMTHLTFKDRLRAWFYNSMNFFANRWTDGQTAITMRMARAVRIPPGKLWGVWPSGVNIDYFSSAVAARGWPSSEDPIHLIYSGALYPERNIYSLGEVVIQANEDGMNFILSIIGKGPQLSTLQKLSKHSPGAIQILTPVPHEQLSCVFAKHHVGVLPFPDRRIFQVSSPVKLFEYMASGMPILATRIACHTDILANKDFIFWAKDSTPTELYQALAQIFKSRHLLKEKGFSAAEAAYFFSWGKSAKELSNSLERGELLCRQTGIQFSLH